MITKNQVASNLFCKSSSALVSLDTERNTNSTSYVLLKSFKFAGAIIPQSQFTVKYEHKMGTAGISYTKLLLNSTELIEDDNNTTNYEEVSYDLDGYDVKKGDYLYLYAKITNGAGDSYVKNFRIYAALSPVVQDTDTSEVS